MKKYLLLLFFSICPVSASATIITADLMAIGGNTWSVDYTIINDTLAFPIEEFTIFFDLGLYENISAGITPANWDPLVIQPDPLLPDDGLYDALALVSGIPPLGGLGGFNVSFDWLGAGIPGSQFYEIVDPFTFDVLDSGLTVVNVRGSVPEPPIQSLLAIGLLWVIFRRKTAALLLGTSSSLHIVRTGN